jgi:type II secretory pathway component PulC
MYQVGERLPGGSVLRRVEANQVVLWNKGREERLTLQPPVAHFLRPVESLSMHDLPLFLRVIYARLSAVRVIKPMNSFTGAQALRSMFLFVALAIVPLPGALRPRKKSGSWR